MKESLLQGLKKYANFDEIDENLAKFDWEKIKKEYEEEDKDFLENCIKGWEKAKRASMHALGKISYPFVVWWLKKYGGK